MEVNLIVTPKEEVCDGIDNDCDGIVDEGCCEDKDGDGHYAISAGCPQGDDCNDGEENIYPGAPEFCDGKDNNCNRIIDEGFGCEVSIMINPSEVWPRGAGSSPVNADVIITSITPASYEGCTINLRVESVDQSGGHMHDGLRPAGRISPSTITIPSCTIGSWSATYTSSEVSGEERIIAEVDGEEVNEAMITVRVPGLMPLPVGENYELVGTPANHSGTNDPCRQVPPNSLHYENHYGTGSLISAVINIANDYATFHPGIRLRINDMSLPMGGLFDINNNWATPHSSHRAGTNADIGFTGIDGNGRCVGLNLDDLRRSILSATGGRLPYVHGDHYHITVNP